MQPDNVLIGDVETGIDLPEAKPSEVDLAEEKAMAQFSQTAEFQRIKTRCEERIGFYQTYLPDGRPIASVSKKELEGMWIAANVIIAEFKQLLESYETAAEVVEEANKNVGLQSS